MLKNNGLDSGEFLQYKDRPLVRQGKDIYYGDLSAEYHVYMMIMNEKESANDQKVPDTIMLQLLKKGANSPEKQTITHGLFDAFEIASAWLDRHQS